MIEGTGTEETATTRPRTGFVRRAVIDVGTNSIKLLVADVHGSEVSPVLEESEQTRLGQGFYETQLLQPDAIRSTAEAVAGFARRARELSAQAIRVFATSAARDARNPQDLTRAIKQTAGLETEIVSGDQEAGWVFLGVASDPRFGARPMLILDVGGGSTEFILGEGRERHHQKSYRIGSVRLVERLRLGDPPGEAALARCRAELRAFLQEQVVPDLLPALKRMGPGAVRLVGTGGTVTILARIGAALEHFDRARIEAVSLTKEHVRVEVERQWRMTLEERRQIPGMPGKRADIFLTGIAIYEAAMESFGFDTLQVSTRGLRFGAVLDP